MQAGEFVVLYCVEPGDTLSTIARRFLGDGGRFLEIYRDNIKYFPIDSSGKTSPDRIVPGMTLLIQSRP